MDYDTLRQLMGLPDSVQIVRVHSMPGSHGTKDGVRLMAECPDFPGLHDGEEIPDVRPQYDVLPGGGGVRFKGFKILVDASQPIDTPSIEDGL